VKKGSAQENVGQYLERENHFFNVVAVVRDKRRGSAYTLGKKIKNEQSGEQGNCEVCLALTFYSPSRLENHAEYKGVHHQHEKGIEEGPTDTQNRAPVSTDYLSFYERHYQRAIVPDTSDGF
jgi:hypothetical protein